MRDLATGNLRPAGTARGRRRQDGFSVPEMLLMTALMGFVFVMAMAGWAQNRERAGVMQSARTLQGLSLQARMFAVYRGVAHFLVIDPAKRTMAIWIDSNRVDDATTGKFDDADTRSRSETWPQFVALAFPAGTTSMPNPFDPADDPITEAWTVPGPDTEGAWDGSLKGFTATSTGRLESAEATPVIIDRGVVVFSQGAKRASAVAIRGRQANIRTFYYLNDAWIKQ